MYKSDILLIICEVQVKFNNTEVVFDFSIDYFCASVHKK